jgi:pimeloyl-ACP methyl ester carboxylesterase
MLILLPGLICDDHVFASQSGAFPDAHAFAGYGLLDSLTDMARLVLSNAPERFDLLGHSMGGRVALEVYRLAPERVQRLALVSTGVHGVKPGESDKRSDLQQLGRTQGFEALVDAWLPPMIGPIAKTQPAIVDALRRMCVAQGQDAFDAHVTALLNRRDVSSQLADIACPTLVMTGELDTWSPPSQHVFMAESIASSRLVIVPGAGHMVTVEAPEAVNTAIAAWRDQT